MGRSNEYANTRVGYLIEGAKRSRYHADQWARYLRKTISEDGELLSKEEISAIIESGALTMFQIVVLKRAMQPGTPTHQRIAALNQRTATPMVTELLRRHGRV